MSDKQITQLHNRAQRRAAGLTNKNAEPSLMAGFPQKRAVKRVSAGRTR